MSELIVDNFAGGGGASLGIEMATWRSPDIAINHDREAIAMHEANHPHTRHYCESVWDVCPREVTGGKPVGLAWFSPDCKHFSKAKGARPVDKNIRGLAWVVIRWAYMVRPRIIMLENVEEFQDWGPLLADNRPCPARKSVLFRRWVGMLRGFGYQVEWREDRACNFGAPTIRKRLQLIARCDGQPIRWPTPTHGPGLIPYRTAAECIDWSQPIHSIFLSPEEVKAMGLRIKRPLADATMRRIARGIWKYVIHSGHPFIAPITHSGDARVHDITEPLRTITTAHRGEMALVAPFFAQRYGERAGQEPRTRPVTEPLQTIVPTGNGAQMCAAFLAQHNTGVTGHDVRDPLSTITMRGTQQNVVMAHLQRQFGHSIGSDIADPVGTVTAGGGGKTALVTSHLSQLYSSNSGGGGDLRQPMRTVTAGGLHTAEVRAFLIKYYGSAVGQALDDPLHSVTSKPRFGLVTIDDVDYRIVDIAMRMLIPRELYRAQGFPDTYKIDPIVDGRPLTATAQIRMCGNSVSPQFAAAMACANYVHNAC